MRLPSSSQKSAAPGPCLPYPPPCRGPALESDPLVLSFHVTRHVDQETPIILKDDDNLSAFLSFIDFSVSLCPRLPR